MPNLKLTLVGGGSYPWTPGVLSNLMSTPGLDGCQIVLHDINPEALELNYQLACKYKEVSGSAITFARTLNQEESLEGADFVIVTISTGGLRTMEPDLLIPEEYGIFQTVGDTVGPGGLSRALRNIPVFLEMARAMERRCPEAWMINLSNPLSALTRVVNKETGIRALGMCHGIYGTAQEFADFFGVTLADVAFVNTGLDHCSWFTEFLAQGRDAWDLLEEKGLTAWLAKPAAEAKQDPVFAPLYDLRCGLLLGQHFGALPAIGDRHMCEFFPNFLQGRENVAKYGLVRTPISARAERYTLWRKRIERTVRGEEQPRFQEATDVLGARQSDDIASWVLALSGLGPTYEDNVNAPNLGQVPELPPGAIVETRCVLDATGYRPLASPLPTALEPVILPHVIRQELTVEAGVEGDFEKAVAALASDPLVRGIADVRPMLTRMLEATKEYLPQFGS
jgi:alpha-galactosidase/6-phospho-beta-glucosidase family protein